MLKVFIVEDEIIVREGIRDNINWEYTDFTFCGEAPDGESALPLIQELKPDILITDIRMPFMDGLQLSRIAKKNMPWIKIIILSGHDEFEFAKEAISIGVNEYILKPISPQNLLKSLNKVAAQISEEKKLKEDVENLKLQLISDEIFLKEKFLLGLSLGQISASQAIEQSKRYHINLISKYFMVMLIEVESNELLKVEALVTEVISYNTGILHFKRSTTEIILILKGEQEEELKENGYLTAQLIQYRVEKGSESCLSIYMGRVQERIQGIVQSLQDSYAVKNQMFGFYKHKIMGFDDLSMTPINRETLSTLARMPLDDFLQYGGKAGISAYLEEYLKSISESAVSSKLFITYMVMDVLITAAKFINGLGGDAHKIIPEIKDIDVIIAQYNSVEELFELLNHALNRTFDYKESKKQSKYIDILDKAKTYIHSHYSDPDISLISTSNHVHLSSNHFSTIFSQETGETFIEYLTKTRIKKAMELLKTTNQKSREIAYAVGYNDPHYFSYMFKKATGTTPKEYRG